MKMRFGNGDNLSSASVFLQIIAGTNFSTQPEETSKEGGIFGHIQIAAASLWDKLSK